MSIFLPAEEELILKTDRIQGNVIAGFKADHQELVGLRIDDKQGARGWLAQVAARLTSVEEIATHRGHCGEGESGPEPAEPWINLALTYRAVEAIGFSGDFDDGALKAGIEQRRARLGDREGASAGWKVGGGTPIDVLLIIAAANGTEASDCADELVSEASALSQAYRDSGATLPTRGHEHFGFRDGVSQPGVFGRFRHDRECPLTHRDWESPPPGDGALEAAPGRPLIWPGEFVFGYPAQGTAPRHPDLPKHAGDSGHEWTDNGSLLVLRRLHQDVAAFRRFCREKAARLDSSGEWPGLSPDLLAALIVGRWPSGALVDAAATADPAAGHDDPVNDFDFADDRAGASCPLDSHIRKVNPRAGETDVTPLVRRIIRRGIPYGPEFPRDAEADDGVDRGLLFLCYQSSIESQFEAITHDWMNSGRRPAGVGHDVLVGQRELPRVLSLVHPGDGRTIEIDVDVDWITPTGGAYLFAPAIDALQRL
jgi:Dyp-type peroxidase family